MWIVHNNEQKYQGLILDSMATFWSILLLSSPSSCSPLLFISNLYSLSSFLTSSSHSMTSVLLKKSVTDFYLKLNICIFSSHSFLGCGFSLLLHLDVLGVLSKFPSIRFGIYVCNICKILVIGFFSSIKLFHPSGMESTSSFSHFKHALTFLASSFTVPISTTYQPCLSACPWQPPPEQTRFVSWFGSSQYRWGPRSSYCSETWF